MNVRFIDTSIIMNLLERVSIRLIKNPEYQTKHYRAINFLLIALYKLLNKILSIIIHKKNICWYFITIYIEQDNNLLAFAHGVNSKLVDVFIDTVPAVLKSRLQSL